MLKVFAKNFFFKKKRRPEGDLIWINGVSIGEAKTAIIIAEQIKKIILNQKFY